MGFLLSTLFKFTFWGRASRMRKIVMSVAVLFLVLSFLGCASQQASTGGDDAAAATEQTGGVTFTYKPQTAAKAVFLSGSFNGWNPNDKNFAMTDAENDGTWEIVVPLKPGQYQYKFVVDGKWMSDPKNPNQLDDGFGGKNSLLTVK